jgi:hypothetical protein
MEKGTFARLWAMDRTGATGVEVPVNRDAVLEFVLIMFFLQRTESCKGNNPSTFPVSVNDDLQTRSSPSRKERVARSGFS